MGIKIDFNLLILLSNLLYKILKYLYCLENVLPL